jgi:hypothetical protein
MEAEKEVQSHLLFIGAVIMLRQRLNLHYHRINLLLFDFKFTFFMIPRGKTKTIKG